MLKPVYFRYRDLKLLDACEEREVFRQVFGDKPVLVTVTTAVAHADRFNWLWIIRAALNPGRCILALRHLQDAFSGDELLCVCRECDPDGAKRRLMARVFAEHFLAQGGMPGRKNLTPP